MSSRALEAQWAMVCPALPRGLGKGSCRGQRLGPQSGLSLLTELSHWYHQGLKDRGTPSGISERKPPNKGSIIQTSPHPSCPMTWTAVLAPAFTGP